MPAKIDLSCRWLTARGLSAEHGELLLGLLAAIQSDGSLGEAAQPHRLSYRIAWALINNLVVAATFAAGRADVGFGICVTATQYRLACVLVLTESYYLACSHNVFEGIARPRVLDILRNPRIRQRITRLPGNDTAACGMVVEPCALLAKE